MPDQDDDLETVFADESSVRPEHIDLQGRRKKFILPRAVPTGVPNIMVQAALTCALDAKWVRILRSVAKEKYPIKWNNVMAFVLTGRGSEASAVRDGLSEAIIVVTDALQIYREVDLAMLDRRGSISLLSPGWQTTPVTRSIRAKLDKYVARDLLDGSGYGSAKRLLRTPLPGEGYRASLRRIRPDKEIEQDRSLRQAVHLATSATTLMAHEHDPDARFLDELRSDPTVCRFGDPYAEWRDRLRLEALAARRIVFDEGHADVVRAVSALREQAEQRVDEGMVLLSGRSLGGFVGEGCDQRELRLQLADIAAGWASEILHTFDFARLHATFRVVIFNGIRLSALDAGRLDHQRIAHHRSFVVRAA